MNKYLHYWTLLLLSAAMLSACQTTMDEEQKGVFIISNQSGHDLELKIYSTRNRQQLPLSLRLPNNTSVERVSYGGAGNIAYPELFSQGDSVRLLFQDGKQLLHYCPQAQQLNGQCLPARNLLALNQYQVETLSEHTSRFSYTITAADYALAR
ncbi:hypothetical protein [Hymenobacter glacieicola]|nr:hypothetical protein [Hymenobacter glacieicola]